MLKRGTTRSFRERKVLKPIIPIHKNTTRNDVLHNPDKIQCSFSKQAHQKVSEKVGFVIRKRNTSMMNPDIKNKENNPNSEKKLQKEVQKKDVTKQKVQEVKVNGWITDNNDFYTLQIKKTLNRTGKSERASSLRPKNKSKNKKINECKIRKVNWGHNLPFNLGLSRIMQNQAIDTPIQSLKQLYQLIQ